MPQMTSTETLRMCVHTEPVPVEAARGGGIGGFLASKKTISSSAVLKPISLSTASSGKNEIFVDILERLTVLFNANVRRKRAEKGNVAGGIAEDETEIPDQRNERCGKVLFLSTKGA